MKKNILFLSVMSVIGLIAPVYADALKSISLEYCATTGNILSYATETEVKTDICYSVSNTSDQEVMIKINFVDGTFTNDQRQNRACLDENTKETFGQYITNYQKTILLSGGETKKETAQLLYPTGTDGQYHGCITYSVVDAPSKSSTGENSNFSILMRKAKFIDVLVGHPEKVTGGIVFKPFPLSGNNLSPNPKMRIYQDNGDNKYIIELTIRNESSVEQDVVLTGIASNFLTYKSTFTETRKLLKGQEFIITKKLEDIPNYHLDVDIALAYTPVIQGIPNLVPQTSYIHETARVFIVNIITIATGIGLLIFLLLLILLIKSATKRKSLQPGVGPIPTVPVAPIVGVPGVQQPVSTSPQPQTIPPTPNQISSPTPTV